LVRKGLVSDELQHALMGGEKQGWIRPVLAGARKHGEGTGPVLEDGALPDQRFDVVVHGAPG
jgi:hypothetical protein